MTLKDYRKKKKLTQEEMAKLIGISCSMYSKIEKKDRKPSLTTIAKIKEKFNDINVEIFLN